MALRWHGLISTGENMRYGDKKAKKPNTDKTGVRM